MNARGRQETTPPTDPAGRGRSRGATCLCPAHSFPAVGPCAASQAPAAAPQTPALTAPSCAADHWAGASGRRVRAHGELRHRRHARSGDAHADGNRAHHLAQPGRGRRLFDPAASLLERVPKHQLDVAETAPAGRRQSVRRRRRGRLRLHRRHEDHHRQRRRQRRPRSDERLSFHFARRSEHRGSIAGRGHAGQRDPAGARRCGCASPGQAASRGTSIAPA